MRTVFLFSFLFLRITLALSQLREPEALPAEKMRVAGIKEVSVYRFEVNDSLSDFDNNRITVSRKKPELFVKFNTAGEPEETRHYNEDGYLSKIIRPEYASSGLKASETEEVYTGDSILVMTQRTVFIHNEKKQITLTLTHLLRNGKPDGETDSVTYQYQPDGNLIQKIHTRKGLPPTRYLIATDSADSVEAWTLEYEGEVSAEKNVYFNEKGQITRILYTPGNPKGSREIRFGYDEKGQLRVKDYATVITAGSVEATMPEIQETFQYNEKGLLTEMISWDYNSKRKDFVPAAVTRYDYMP